MNTNKFKKVVHAALWYEGKILLSQVLKDSYHKGYWSDCGGKMENDEYFPVDAVVRETYEETDLDLDLDRFEFVDCFIYPEREIKTFLFEVLLNNDDLKWIKNTEPHKQSDWQWFTIKDALKLKLMPSVRYYLEKLE